LQFEAHRFAVVLVAIVRDDRGAEFARARDLIAGASAGMMIQDGSPSIVAAAATPCAWLPDEKATTPLARSAAGICEILL